jgi:hypothetical protein
MARCRAKFGLRSSRESHENLPPCRRIENEAKTPSSKEVPPLPKEDPDPLKETLTGEFPGEASSGVWPGGGALSVPAESECFGELPPMRKL